MEVYFSALPHLKKATLFVFTEHQKGNLIKIQPSDLKGHFSKQIDKILLRYNIVFFLVKVILRLTLLKSNSSWLNSANNIVYVSFSKTRLEFLIWLLKANVDDFPFLALKAAIQ